MNFGPILDTVSLRERRLLEANIINLHKSHSDIMFPTKCKKCDIIPNGLRLRNTFISQRISLFNKGRVICDQTGRLAKRLRSTTRMANNDYYIRTSVRLNIIYSSGHLTPTRSLQDNWTFTATYKRKNSWNTRYINFT